MTEEWRDIKGFEGLYQVSNLGRVKSVDRVTLTTKGRLMHTKGKILKLGTRADDRQIVVLCDGKSKYVQYVYRLVAEAFLPNPDNLPCINHKDEQPLNNTLDNLEWCTYKYNSNYGTIRERLSKALRGRKQSPEEIQRRILATAGKHPGMSGKHHTEESKRKIGDAMRRIRANKKW